MLKLVGRPWPNLPNLTTRNHTNKSHASINLPRRVYVWLTRPTGMYKIDIQLRFSYRVRAWLFSACVTGLGNAGYYPLMFSYLSDGLCTVII